MGSQTAAGSSLGISALLPATHDAAGYAALTFIEIGQVEKLGTFGAAFAKVEYQPLKGAKQKYKGSADYGALQPSIAIDDADAGQALMLVAADDETQKLYSFRVTLQDGAKRYFRGRVFGSPETADGADTMLLSTPTVEICTRVVRVDASATPTPAPTLSQPSITPTSGPVGTTFTAVDGTVTNGTLTGRRWLLGTTAIGTGTTITPNAGGSLTLENTAVGTTRAAITSTSAAVTVSAVTPTPVPINTALPAITGAAQEGQILTASTGTWSNNPTAYAYQWKRGGVAISGSINATRTLNGSDVGSIMSCTVTATNAGGSASVETAGTAAVIAASVPVPVNTVAPVVTGTGTVGQVLTTDNGTWSNSPTGYTYAWRRDGVDIAGATSQTYTLVSADAGKTITSRVFAVNAGGTAGATSAGVAVAAAANTLPQAASIVAKWSADSAPVLADGASMTTWVDEINGVIASGTATYRTNRLNGKPTIQGNGTTQYLTASQASAPALFAALNSRTYTIIVIAQNIQTMTNGTLVATHTTGSNGIFLTGTGTRVGSFTGTGIPTARTTTPYAGAGPIVIGETSLNSTALGVPGGVRRHYAESTCFNELSTAGPASAGDLGIFARASDGGNKGKAEISDIIVWNRYLTPLDWIQFQMWHSNKYARPLPWASAPKYYVFHGDSLTMGQGTEASENSMPAIVASQMGLSLGQWTNQGIAGIAMVDMNTNATTEVDPVAAVIGKPVVLTAWEWYNQGGTAASAEANSRAYLSARKAANPAVKIVFGTSTANSLNAAARNTYNAAFDANHATNIDGYVPIHTNVNIGIDGSADAANTYFGADKLHLTGTSGTSGYRELAGLFYPVVSAQ